MRQHVWAQRLTLPDGQGGLLCVTCVIACETDAPKDTKPIEWRLLTNRAADTAGGGHGTHRLISLPRKIETFAKVLKNGCRVEALQLGGMAKIELALAVYMVVAWRQARLVRLGRTHLDPEATALFTADEPKGAYILAKKPIPAVPPTIREVIRQIAMLGVFLGGKADGEPGVKTL